MRSKRKKFCNNAFTLAEILITIGIIGVVAAITIPTLITNYQKKITATKLKKTYAELTNAVKLSEADNGEVSGWNITNKSEENFDEYILPYIKASKKNYSSLNYTCANGNNCHVLGIAHSKTAVYTLLSGVDIITLQYNSNEKYIDTVVDLNGVNNKPNKIGKDTFYIYIHPKLGLRMSQENQGEANQGITSYKSRKTLLNGPASYGYNCKNLGIWCGALIQRDGWTISKDYPW